MKKYKRRRFLIKRALQVKLLLGYFFFVISGGIFFIVLMGFFTTKSMTISYNSNDMEMVQTPLTLLKLSLSSQWIFLVAVALALAILAVRIPTWLRGHSSDLNRLWTICRQATSAILFIYDQKMKAKTWQAIHTQKVITALDQYPS